MSYASQPTSNSNGTLVLITLVVCALSIVEFVGLVVGYFTFTGALASRSSRELRQLQADLALVQAAERQARLQREEMERNRPRTAPTVTPPRTNNSSSNPTSPGSPYYGLVAVASNDRVHILWGGKWYPGSVIEKNAVQAKVHYDNYADSFDEWVTVDRLRRMLPSDPEYRNGRPVASECTPGKNAAENLNAPFNSRVPAQDTVTRSWRDRSGSVFFRGRLYANYGSAIRLIDGTPGAGSYQSIPYAFANLSAADQAYVKRFPEVSPDSVMSPQTETPRNITPPPSPVFPPVVEAPQPPPPAAVDPLKMLRTWSDSTGQFKLEATFLSVSNGQVQLQRPDGKVVTMPLNKLAPADRALIRAKYPNE